jgi:hypothetical protein
LLGLLESLFQSHLAVEVCVVYVLAIAIAISVSALLQPGCWLQTFFQLIGKERLNGSFFVTVSLTDRPARGIPDLSRAIIGGHAVGAACRLQSTVIFEGLPAFRELHNGVDCDRFGLFDSSYLRLIRSVYSGI